MLEINNVSKSFNGVQVIKDINGKFEKGKINLIIGASGTGKTVLLKCVVGLEKPDEGSILYDGRDFTGGSRELMKEIRREIGMLFQGAALFDSKNVEQNVMFPLDTLTTTPGEEKLERVNFCLHRVGLENANKIMPAELSGGMKKRVGIARAIAMNSKYLFCDEPNSGLDPQTALKIDNLIKEITEEFNITTIVVTHDMNSVLEIGEYVMFMYEGEKLWEGHSKDIMKVDVKELKEFLFANKLVRELKT